MTGAAPVGHADSEIRSEIRSEICSEGRNPEGRQPEGVPGNVLPGFRSAVAEEEVRIPAEEEGCDSAGPDDKSAELMPGELELVHAWRAYRRLQPKLATLDVQIGHLLGEKLDELSMAQITELLDVQRALVVRLEEARLSLVQRQERELVEERMLQEFERHIERHNITLQYPAGSPRTGAL